MQQKSLSLRYTFFLRPFSKKSLTELSLSPNATRHLRDGWIVGPNDELVLWVPPSQRAGLADLRQLGVLGNPKDHVTKLNLEHMVCGTDWELCQISNSTSTIRS